MVIPHQVRNLTGQVFGRWTVLGYDGIRNGGALWLCQCVCGNRKIVMSSSLVTGGSKSCGCLAAELAELAANSPSEKEIQERAAEIRKGWIKLDKLP
jgi:hypothetical protein